MPALRGSIPWNKGKTGLTRVGVKHTEETKRLLSQLLLGRKAWNKGMKTEDHLGLKNAQETAAQARRGVPPANKGKKGLYRHSEDTRRKMSGRKIGHEVTSETRDKISRKHARPGSLRKYTRRQALVRDDYSCQICGLHDPEVMEVDHIKPKSQFPDLVDDMNNLVTLCANCHRRKTKRNKDYRQRKYII